MPSFPSSIERRGAPASHCSAPLSSSLTLASVAPIQASAPAPSPFFSLRFSLSAPHQCRLPAGTAAAMGVCWSWSSLGVALASRRWIRPKTEPPPPGPSSSDALRSGPPPPARRSAGVAAASLDREVPDPHLPVDRVWPAAGVPGRRCFPLAPSVPRFILLSGADRGSRPCRVDRQVQSPPRYVESRPSPPFSVLPATQVPRRRPPVSPASPLPETDALYL